MPWPLHPQGKSSWYPLDRRLGGPQSCSGCSGEEKNFFKKVLNVHRVHDVRQMDIHMAKPLVPEPSLVKVEIAIGKLKSYKSLGTDQILAKLIKAGG
jgi:hypothetical protein